MAGLYIHVPFCKTVCKYCDFYKTSNVLLQDLYIQSLLKEIEKSEFFFSDFPVRTIYFGGGTPSLISSKNLDLIFEKLSRYLDFSKIEEITLEINPDDFNASFVSALKNTPVNRLSFGVQSIYDDILKYLGRRHNSLQIFESLELANSSGYNNVTVDLIYGIPGLSNDAWIKTLEVMFQNPFTHLSAYHLIIEKNTVFYNEWIQKRLVEVDESFSSFQYNYLVDYLKQKQFQQYEVSNFSLSGCESRHNSLYWSGEEYLGLGPSAHSYFNNTRRWNVSDVGEYNRQLMKNEDCYTDELLTETDLYNELIMLGLRTVKGVSLTKLKQCGDSYYSYFMNKSIPFFNENLLIVEGDYCFLRNESLFLSDGVIEKLFLAK